MTSYKLPDLLRNWPWERKLSPFYQQAKQESSAWVATFRPFSAKGQKAFDACDLNLLASLTYSNRDQDFVRAGCDLMNFYFVYDEYTDVCGPDIASHLAKACIDAMRNPDHQATNIHLLGEMTRQFWKRAEKLVSRDSSCFEHFIETEAAYLDAVTQEAQERESKTVRSVKDYLSLRRDSCGGRPTLALTEFGLDLPDEVMKHPTIVALREIAVDLIIVVNDMHSYVREFSCGHANHNLITSVMNEYNIDLQSAFNWLGDHTDGLIARFLQLRKELPSWSAEVDLRVQEYVNGLGQWVRGNDDWSCESKRYYGDDGPKVRESRVVYLRPGITNYLQKEDVKKTMAHPAALEYNEKGVVANPGPWDKLQELWSLALQKLRTSRSWLVKP